MKRKNPTSNTAPSQADVPQQSEHEKLLGEMHDALYALGDRVRKPYPRDGDKLLPEELQRTELPETRTAKKYIVKLHKQMKSMR